MLSKKQVSFIGITLASIVITLIVLPIAYGRSRAELSIEESEKLTTELLTIVKEKTPADALNTLSTAMKSDTRVANACHALVHEIGRASYSKYKDFETSIGYGDELCGSGYLHGVIEERFYESDDALKDMQTLCEPNDGACLHGVGHGLMYYTTNDVKKSLELCRSYEQKSSRVRCSEGVFMEHFATDQSMHVSEFLDKDNIFTLCQKQDPLFKGTCYFYAPRYFLKLNPYEYEGAFDLCSAAEKNYVGSCVKGVGSIAMKQNIEDRPFVEGLCKKHGGAYTESCAQGLESYLLVHNGGKDK